MILKFFKLCAVALLLVGCSKQDSKLSELVFVTGNGPVTYYVETAATPKEMAEGLMHRQELKADSGMIFVLSGQEEVAMWMEDTLIPLDIIFVNSNGKIVDIHENAKPMSTEIIRPQSNEPLSAVVEVNGGDVKKHGIKIGDMVEHKTL